MELPEAAPVDSAPSSGDARVCPIAADFLPPHMRKHVDPASPPPLRMMAAKGLVPLSPSDLVGALFMLSFDAAEEVAQAASTTAKSLPDRVLSGALRDEEVKPQVLGWFLDLHWDNERYAEALVLNASTPDAAISSLASRCSARIAELVAQNQIRLLRTDQIIRQLCLNPSASPALVDSVCDFAVRSGVVLDDVPQMQQARVRIYGAAPVVAGPTAAEIVREFAADVDAEEQARQATAQAIQAADADKLNLTQRIAKMNVAEKIKLATRGNKEIRGILMRDTNKLVAVATISSPRITEGEVLKQAQNKTANDEVLRIIYNSRNWMKSYQVKLAIVKNPRIPQSVTLKLLGTLQEADVKSISKDRTVPSSLQGMARKLMNAKEERKK